MVYMVYLVLEAKFMKNSKSLSDDSDMSYEQHIDDEVLCILERTELTVG